MRKSKKIIALICAFVLCFGNIGYVHAEETAPRSEAEEVVENSAEPLAEEVNEPKTASVKSLDDMPKLEYVSIKDGQDITSLTAPTSFTIQLGVSGAEGTYIDSVNIYYACRGNNGEDVTYRKSVHWTGGEGKEAVLEVEAELGKYRPEGLYTLYRIDLNYGFDESSYICDSDKGILEMTDYITGDTHSIPYNGELDFNVVESEEDTTAPILTSIAAEYIEGSIYTNRTVSFKCRFLEKGSGIKKICIWYTNEDENTLACGYNEHNDGELVGEGTESAWIYVQDRGGLYKIRNIEVTDCAGNTRVYEWNDESGKLISDDEEQLELDITPVSFEVKEDLADPEITSIKMLTSGTIYTGGKAELQVGYNEIGSGVSDISIRYASKYDDYLEFNWNNSKEGTYVGNGVIKISQDKILMAGDYTIFSVRITDYSGRSVYYYYSSETGELESYDGKTAEVDCKNIKVEKQGKCKVAVRYLSRDKNLNLVSKTAISYVEPGTKTVGDVIAEVNAHQAPASTYAGVQFKGWKVKGKNPEQSIINDLKMDAEAQYDKTVVKTFFNYIDKEGNDANDVMIKIADNNTTVADFCQTVKDYQTEKEIYHGLLVKSWNADYWDRYDTVGEDGICGMYNLHLTPRYWDGQKDKGTIYTTYQLLGNDSKGRMVDTTFVVDADITKGEVVSLCNDNAPAQQCTDMKRSGWTIDRKWSEEEKAEPFFYNSEESLAGYAQSKEVYDGYSWVSNRYHNIDKNGEDANITEYRIFPSNTKIKDVMDEAEKASYRPEFVGFKFTGWERNSWYDSEETVGAYDVTLDFYPKADNRLVRYWISEDTPEGKGNVLQKAMLTEKGADISLPDSMGDYVDIQWDKNTMETGGTVVDVYGRGNKRDSLELQDISKATVSLSGTSYTYSGKAITPSVTVKSGDVTLKKNTDYTVTYANNVNVGTATVTITGKGNYVGTATKTFKINAKNMTATAAALSGTSYTYSGKAITPSVTVKSGDVTLKKNTDYTVAYANNTNVGTATVTITGKGNYTGAVKKTFKINPRNISSSAAVTLSATHHTYTGNVKTPTVTVKYGSTVLKKNTDYTVSYSSGRKYIGRYAVKVTFRGNYSGSKTMYFTIGPKNPTSVTTSLYGYDDVQLRWSKVSGASGYVIYYKKSTSSSYVKLGVVSAAATSYKKANLADGAQYTFKVVAYKKVGSYNCYNAGKTSSIYTLRRTYTPVVSGYGSKVKVRWSNIAGESGYQISQSTTKTGTKIVSTYATTSGNYRYVSATKGKYYYYKVRAYRQVGKTKIYGPWSTAVRYRR